MSPFPNLTEEDFQVIQAALAELLAKSESCTVLFVEKAGYLICECGEGKAYNTTELATLGANAFAATQFMADRLSETNFSGMYQQGEQRSVLWQNVDENSLVMVVFNAVQSAGAVKYYALTTAKQIADQLDIAKLRDPGGGFDLATLDPTDMSDVFRRKEEQPPAS
jgi:predicted regulator of Ras-like GTPase activity (Roadblock/LC7/MglB family)